MSAVNVRISGEDLIVSFLRRSSWLSKVRALPSAQVERPKGLGMSNMSTWRVAFTRENYDAMVEAGFPVDHLDRPTRTEFLIDKARTNLTLKTPYSPQLVQKIKGLPDSRHWKSGAKVWVVAATRPNLKYLVANFPECTWTDEAAEVRDRLLAVEEEAERQREFKRDVLDGAFDVDGIEDYVFGTRPYDHQAKAFMLCRDRENYGLFMEQGTGKTKVVIDNAAYLFQHGELSRVLVVCPNSVKTVWAEEIELHMPSGVDYQLLVWDSGMAKWDRGFVIKNEAFSSICRAAPDTLTIFVTNVETFQREDKGLGLAEAFLEYGSTMVVVDESSKIKTPSANRTRCLWKVGRMADYKRILTGTPVTQSPLDLFAQFYFLDPDLLGYSSYTTFKHHFAEFGGYEGREVTGYKNMDELTELIEPHTYRVTRDECLDLPPKSYSKRVVELGREQQKLYHEMRDTMIASLSETERVTAPIVLTQLLRLQQIVGGFLPIERDEDGDIVVHAREIKGTNPKVKALVELAGQTTGKIVIWARFRAELKLIADSLKKEFGDDSVVMFYGDVSGDERAANRAAFQDPDSPVRFFVGNQATGGMGITLTAANTVVYYSNTFSLEERLQSEDRVHRIGQANNVEYIDLIAAGTIDEKIVRALRSKKSYADLITGDEWDCWI